MKLRCGYAIEKIVSPIVPSTIKKVTGYEKQNNYYFAVNTCLNKVLKLNSSLIRTELTEENQNSRIVTAAVAPTCCELTNRG